jgi:hypothetical protein
MEKYQRERGNIGALPEQRHRDKRILRQPLLAVDERKDHEATNDKQRDYLRRVPREKHSAKVQTQKEHKCTTEERENTVPVDSFDPIHERCMFMADIEEKQDEHGCKAADRKIDVD